jgi:hypothetical protein
MSNSFVSQTRREVRKIEADLLDQGIKLFLAPGSGARPITLAPDQPKLLRAALSRSPLQPCASVGIGKS